jgi:2-dehydropantoate 2-reductase
MKIAVMGTGGVGGYFGTRLALGGSDVAFVARGAQLAAMREHGLRVRSAGGDLHLAPVRATDDPREIGPVDLVLFGVKLWDTSAAAEAIRPLLGPDTAVVSFQNGVVKDDILMETLGRRAVIGGVCYIAATIAEPGVIVHTGTMQRLVFGEYDGTRSARVELFEAACRQAGIDAEVSADITRALWEKFVFLVAFSAVTSTTRRPIGAVRAHPQTRRLLAAAMQEVVDVGRAQGVALAPDFVADR